VVLNSWKIAIPVLARIVVMFLAQQKFAPQPAVIKINLQPAVVIITDAIIIVVLNSWKIAIPVLARIVVMFLAQQKFAPQPAVIKINLQPAVTRINLQQVVIIKAETIIVAINSWKIATPVLARIVVLFLVQQMFAPQPAVIKINLQPAVTRINLQQVVIIKAETILVAINSWRIATPVLARIVVMFLVQQMFAMVIKINPQPAVIKMNNFV